MGNRAHATICWGVPMDWNDADLPDVLKAIGVEAVGDKGPTGLTVTDDGGDTGWCALCWHASVQTTNESEALDCKPFVEPPPEAHLAIAAALVAARIKPQQPRWLLLATYW